MARVQRPRGTKKTVIDARWLRAREREHAIEASDDDTLLVRFARLCAMQHGELEVLRTAHAAVIEALDLRAADGSPSWSWNLDIRVR